MHDQAVNRERLVQTFLDFTGINSPSRSEGAMAQAVMLRLRELGATFVEDDAGEKLGVEQGNLFARLPGTVDAPPILFCAHIDTVEQTVGLRVTREGGLLRSDGTTILGADDKAAVAALIELAHVLRETGVPHPPLELVFSIAEEVGVMGTQVMDFRNITASYGFVPDSSGPVGLIITNAPAQQQLNITVHGKGAHAGMAPEEGISAITVAARAIARLRQGRIDEETTANIGTIAGGKATNIVPDTVEIKAEARSRDPHKLAVQIAHIRACFTEEAAAAGATVDIETIDIYPAFNLAHDSLPVSLASRALAEMGISPTVTATGGGSDANYLNNNGIQCVILSVGYQHPHAHHECQREDDLVLLVQQLHHICRLAGEMA